MSVRGIAFESINVLEDDGMDKLRALGARTLPVVARNGKFVFAQVIRDVVEFLELNGIPARSCHPPNWRNAMNGC